jgi:hypothetical protein
MLHRGRQHMKITSPYNARGRDEMLNKSRIKANIKTDFKNA